MYVTYVRNSIRQNRCLSLSLSLALYSVYIHSRNKCLPRVYMAEICWVEINAVINIVTLNWGMNVRIQTYVYTLCVGCVIMVCFPRENRNLNRLSNLGWLNVVLHFWHYLRGFFFFSLFECFICSNFWWLYIIIFSGSNNHEC